MACQTSQAFLRVEELGLAEQYLTESAEVWFCSASEASNSIDQTIIGCARHSSEERLYGVLNWLLCNEDYVGRCGSS